MEVIEIDSSKVDDVVSESGAKETTLIKPTSVLKEDALSEISPSKSEPCYSDPLPPNFDVIEIPCKQEKKITNTNTASEDSKEFNIPVIQNCRKESDKVDSTNRLLQICEDS